MKYVPGRLERIEENLGRAKSRVYDAACRHAASRKIVHTLSFVGRIIQKSIIFAANTAAVTFVYFIGIGITGLIVKAMKKDIGFSKKDGTSWKNFEQREKRAYLRQF